MVSGGILKLGENCQQLRFLVRQDLTALPFVDPLHRGKCFKLSAESPDLAADAEHCLRQRGAGQWLAAGACSSIATRIFGLNVSPQ